MLAFSAGDLPPSVAVFSIRGGEEQREVDWTKKLEARWDFNTKLH